MVTNELKLNTDQRPFIMVYHDFLESELLDNPYQITLYICLKKFANKDNQCFPSLRKLTKISKMSKRKVQETLKELEEKRVINIENRVATNGGKCSNLYTLCDFKELWNTSNSEEVEAVIDGIDEKRMIEVLTAKGYYVTKEKEPEALQADQSNNDSSTQSNNFNQFDTTTNSAKSQALERYTLDQIKQLFDYDNMLIEHPDRQRDIDSVMGVLHTAMNTSKEVIRISGTDMPAMTVIAKLMKLDKEMLIYAIDKFSEQTERIKNPAAYMLTILYNTPEQYHLDVKNQECYEKAEHSKEAKIETKKFKNGFSNLHQRNYDYEELERDLLNRAHI